VDRPTASLEYVDSDAAPLDVRKAIWGTAAFLGGTSAYLLLGSTIDLVLAVVGKGVTGREGCRLLDQCVAAGPVRVSRRR